MKKLSIILFLCVSTLQLSAQLQNLTFGTDSTFEVITWNIEWFPKNGTTTVDSVRRILQSLDADIIACQEIGDTNVWKQMVATLPDYETVFQTNYYAGLAYLYKPSSVEVLDYYEIYYTSPFWKNFPRAPKVLEVRVQGEEFIIINNHLKCCGDGTLSYGVTNDEENRRYEAMNLIKNYIDTNFPTKNVLVVGDMNDELTDDESNNVFQNVMGDIFNYQFADMAIAEGSSFNWSYPSWPSHLDHILITNELFDEFGSSSAVIETIKIENFLQGGFNYYDSNISDHRPVGFKFDVNSNTTSTKNQLAKANLNIYPNPATNQFSIALKNDIQNGFLEVFNANGQRVKSLMLLNNQSLVEVNIEGLVNGIYYVKVSSENGEMIGKLIVFEP
jgi:endonuclease/exonuclease/phosphatase family metal-dependent hydrolase